MRKEEKRNLIKESLWTWWCAENRDVSPLPKIGPWDDDRGGMKKVGGPYVCATHKKVKRVFCVLGRGNNLIFAWNFGTLES